MWGSQLPSPEGIQALSAAFVSKWSYVLDQMLRHWETPPVGRLTYVFVAFSLNLVAQIPRRAASIKHGEGRWCVMQEFLGSGRRPHVTITTIDVLTGFWR